MRKIGYNSFFIIFGSHIDDQKQYYLLNYDNNDKFINIPYNDFNDNETLYSLYDIMLNTKRELVHQINVKYTYLQLSTIHFSIFRIVSGMAGIAEVW